MKNSLWFLLLLSTSVFADLAVIESRYCGPPIRDSKGQIVRRTDVLTAFQKAHPCPVNGATAGACPGWAKDHVIPLACGGCDAVYNLQWLRNDLKISPNGKDGYELKIYAGPVPNTICKTPVIK